MVAAIAAFEKVSSESPDTGPGTVPEAGEFLLRPWLSRVAHQCTPVVVNLSGAFVQQAPEHMVDTWQDEWRVVVLDFLLPLAIVGPGVRLWSDFTPPRIVWPIASVHDKNGII